RNIDPLTGGCDGYAPRAVASLDVANQRASGQVDSRQVAARQVCRVRGAWQRGGGRLLPRLGKEKDGSQHDQQRERSNGQPTLPRGIFSAWATSCSGSSRK